MEAQAAVVKGQVELARLQNPANVEWLFIHPSFGGQRKLAGLRAAVCGGQRYRIARGTNLDVLDAGDLEVPSPSRDRWAESKLGGRFASNSNTNASAALVRGNVSGHHGRREGML